MGGVRYNFSLMFVGLLLIIVKINSLKNSIDVTYKKGVDAYLGERWSECIAQFERSLHLYKLYTAILSNCRTKCNVLNYKSQVDNNIEYFQMYEKLFHSKNCLLKCPKKEFEESQLQESVSDSTLAIMHTRKPYEYLHLCYFQMNAIPKAASSAYTYLVMNPNNEQMKENLNYYVKQNEVDINEVVDLESEEYEILYELGLKSYKQKKWQEVIGSFEEVLNKYLVWENTCRVNCERQPEQQWASEFTVTISNAIASLLQCGQHCQDSLKALHYNSGVEFLADVLNYLQISYYHLNRYEEAAEAVSSYLLLMPKDKDMLENKKIYSTLTNNTNNNANRPVIIYYQKRDIDEKKLLNIFYQEDDTFDNNILKE